MIEESKSTQITNMINLEDIGVEMSRISINKADIDYQEEKLPSNFISNQSQQPNDQIHFQSTQIQSTQIQSPVTNQNNEWKKPQFQKKKKFGNKIPIKDQSFTKINEMIIQKQEIVIELKNEIQKKVQTKTNKELYIEAQNKKRKQLKIESNNIFEDDNCNYKTKQDSPNSPVPLPLFDCMFCAGLHEHLVLQTVKEKQIQRKYNYKLQQYSENAMTNSSQQNDSHLQNQIIDILDSTTFKIIDLLFVINQLEINVTTYNANTSINDSFQQECNQSLQDRLRQNIQQNLMSNSNQKYDLMSNKHIIKKKQVFQQKVFNNQLDKEEQIQLKDEQEKLMISNMLDNFDEINSEEQSMFINLNIRNRRQKILHELTFETEAYDIYDPQFSSSQEEEYSSLSTESIVQSSEYGSEQIEQQDEKSIIPNEDVKQKKSSLEMMNYDSENESSLSSIHKEIAPITEIDLVKQSKQNLDQVSYGGCKFEEMQDDTVVNKCNQILNFQIPNTQTRFDLKPNLQFHSDHKQYRQMHQFTNNKSKQTKIDEQSQQQVNKNQDKEMVDQKYIKNKLNFQSDKKEMKQEILEENKRSDTSSGCLSEIKFEDNQISKRQNPVQIKQQVKNSLNKLQSIFGANEKLSYSPVKKYEQEKVINVQNGKTKKQNNEYQKMGEKNNTNGPIIRKKNQSIGTQLDNKQRKKIEQTNKQQNDQKGQKQKDSDQKLIRNKNAIEVDIRESKNQQSTSLNDEHEDLPQKPSLQNPVLTCVASTGNLPTLNSFHLVVQKNDFNSKLSSKESTIKQSQIQVRKSQKLTNEEIKMNDFQRKNMLKSEMIITNKNSVRKINKLEFLTNNLQKNKDEEIDADDSKKIKIKSITPNKLKIQEEFQLDDQNRLNSKFKNIQIPNDEYQMHKLKQQQIDSLPTTKIELIQNKLNNQIVKKQESQKINVNNEEKQGLKYYKQLKKKNITSQSNGNLLANFGQSENDNFQIEFHGQNAALTKDQIKLMKQLEKQQIAKSIQFDSKIIPSYIHQTNKQFIQEPKLIQKISNFDSNINQKNVMENYFQTGQFGQSNKKTLIDLKNKDLEINQDQLNEQIINQQQSQRMKDKNIINTKIELDQKDIINKNQQNRIYQQTQEIQRKIIDQQNQMQNQKTKDYNQKRKNSVNQQNIQEKLKQIQQQEIDQNKLIGNKQIVESTQKTSQMSEPQKKVLFPKFEKEDENNKIGKQISINRFENQYLPSFYMQSNMNMFSPMISPSIQQNTRFKDSNQKFINLKQNEQEKQKIQNEKQQRIVYQKSIVHQSTSQLEQMSNSNEMNSFSLAAKHNNNVINNSKSTLKLSENNQTQIQKYKHTAQESKLSYINNQEKQNIEFKSMRKQQPNIENPKYCKIKITRSRSKEQQSAQSSIINLSENQPFSLENKYIFPQKIQFLENQVKLEKQTSDPVNSNEIKQFQSIVKIQKQQNNQEKLQQKNINQNQFIMKISNEQKKNNNPILPLTQMQNDQNKKQKFLTINNVPPIQNFNSLPNQIHQDQDHNKDFEYFKRSQNSNTINKNIRLPILKESDKKTQNSQNEDVDQQREKKIINKIDSQSVISTMINSQQVGQSTFINNFGVNATSTTASSHIINNLLSQRDYSHFNQDTDSTIKTKVDPQQNSVQKGKRGLAYNYSRQNQDFK